MKTAAQFEKQIERYHRLNAEIDLLKCRLVGQSEPIDCGTWEAWKSAQGQKINMEVMGSPPLAELSDEPEFQTLLKLDNEMTDVWTDILGDVDDSISHQKLVAQMIWSFPSLRRWMRYPSDMPTFHHILSCEEKDDPQAYYAARFVYLIESEGRSLEWTGYWFYIDKAFSVWDAEHKQAFAYWINKPFFPKYGIYRLALAPSFV